MIEKEFSKLTRHELLELLLMEARDGQIHKLEQSPEARGDQIVEWKEGEMNVGKNSSKAPTMVVDYVRVYQK